MAPPRMKSTKINWLDQIPSHWGETRIKYLARDEAHSFIDGDWIETPFINSDGIRLIQTGNIGIGKYREQGYRYISEETFTNLDCTEVFPNDILICRLAAPVGRACLAPFLDKRMITSVDNCILKPNKNVIGSFVTYVLSTRYYLDYVDTISRGSTRDRISRSMLGDIHFFLPPVSEQLAIANYLDTKTAQLDELISKKQRLIELLREERTAIIDQAVTKGLNPGVRMKHSGVEWLGEIPEHWEVKKLKYLGEIFNGATPRSSVSEYWNGEINWATPVDVSKARNGQITETERKITREGYLNAGTTMVPIDSIIITTRAPVGNLAIAGVELCTNQGCRSIVPSRCNSKYLFFALHLPEEVFAAISNGTTFNELSFQTLCNLYIDVPPLEEQNTIVKYVEESSERIHKAISRIEREIELLEEYRAALITEVVTGKMQVC